MSGSLLTVTTQMHCPHGALISVVTAGPRPTVSGAPLALATDTFTVAPGCPFVVGTVASPCTTVQWTTSNAVATCSNNATLDMSSVGLCLSAAQAPQGSPLIAGPQTQVTS